MPNRETDPTDGPFTATLGAFDRPGSRPVPQQFVTIAEARRWAEEAGTAAGAVTCKITDRAGRQVAFHTRGSSWGVQQRWAKGKV